MRGHKPRCLVESAVASACCAAGLRRCQTRDGRARRVRIRRQLVTRVMIRTHTHLQLLLEVLERADARLQARGCLQRPARGDTRQGDVAQKVFGEHLVHELVHVRQLERALAVAHAQLSVVVVQRLRIVHAPQPHHPRSFHTRRSRVAPQAPQNGRPRHPRRVDATPKLLRPRQRPIDVTVQHRPSNPGRPSELTSRY